MAIASANRVSIRVADESVFGTPSTAANFQELRMTDDSITPTFNKGESAQIRSDRQLDSNPLLTIATGGDISGEGWYGADIELLLPYFFYNDYIESDTGVTALTIDKTSAAVGECEITRGAGDFTADGDGFPVGYWVKPRGFALSGNSTPRRIKTVTATILTVFDPDDEMQDEGFTGNEQLIQKGLRNGIIDKQLTVEKNWQDLALFTHFSGMKGSTLEYDITAEQIITGKMTFLGSQAITGQTSTGVVPAPSGESMTASVSVGNVEKDGATLATALRSVKFTLDNSLTQTFKVASQFAAQIVLGTVKVTGTIEAYFENLALYNDAIAQTDIALSFRMFDTTGNSIIWTFDRLTLGDAGIPTPGKDQPLIVNIPFSGLRDTTYETTAGMTIQADYLSAA